MSGPVNEHLHEPAAHDAYALERSFCRELIFSIGLALVIAGVGAFTAMTVALVWSSLT